MGLAPGMGGGAANWLVEIMVYLGILDTRKYFVSQKILAKITYILSRISILWDKYGCLVVKMVLRDIYFVPKFLTETVNNVS